MSIALGSLLLGGPLACGSPSSLEPAAEPCVRVYHATVQSIRPLLASGGPEPPPLEDFVSRCRALPLEAERLLCLDPEVALADPARCTEPLAHPEVLALSGWFAAQVLPAGSHAGPPSAGTSPTDTPPMVQPTAQPPVPVDESPSPNPIGGQP